ncbi:aminotransferase class V-fold PLP-dependent enzyme [Thalassobacillus hwangdonensis]|uniref:cysteine desulfurase n=1 Tax=Thalassobacillus hwangdonensis TaxID=546108 RepID=A0ABW3KZY6_9BACI
MDIIYLDHAASSFPKPPGVSQAMIEAVEKYAANPGRGTHRLAEQAGGVIEKTRRMLATKFGVSNPNHVLFFSNATAALNQALKGYPFKKGDHVITTSFEHNSVRRPLEYLKEAAGIDVTYIEGNSANLLEGMKMAMRPETVLLAVSHASNVTGEVAPLKDMIELAKSKDIKVLVDASQTAGHFPIHMKDEGIDMLAFPGHKRLLGPQGTGALLVEGKIELNPIHHGGTGSFSELPGQPDQWPERFESGTLNTPGIAGWHAALKQLEAIVSRETDLTKLLIQELRMVKDVVIYGEIDGFRMPVVAFNIGDIPSHEVGMILDSHYGIAVRAGMHCSPTTHVHFGTENQGAVRASIGPFTTESDIDALVKAVKEIRDGYLEA